MTGVDNVGDGGIKVSGSLVGSEAEPELFSSSNGRVCSTPKPLIAGNPRILGNQEIMSWDSSPQNLIL